MSLASTQEREIKNVEEIFNMGKDIREVEIINTLIPDIKEEIYNYSDSSYATSLKKDKKLFEKQYGAYIKEGHDPESLGKLFNDTKKALESMKA